MLNDIEHHPEYTLEKMQVTEPMRCPFPQPDATDESAATGNDQSYFE